MPGGGGCKDTQIELYGPPVSSVPLRVYTKDLQGYTSDLSCAVLQSRVFLCVNMDHFLCTHHTLCDVTPILDRILWIAAARSAYYMHNLFFLSGVNRLLKLRQQCVQFMSVCHYASFQSRLYIPVNVVDISSSDLASSIIASAVKYDYIPAYNITIILNNWIQSANNQL